MKTRIATEKILITRTYYSDQSESSLARPITWVETKVFVDDELYYSDKMNTELHLKSTSEVKFFLDRLFCIKPDNANTAYNVTSENSQDSKEEELKKLLAPIIQEVVDEIRPKIDLEQFFDDLTIQIKEDLKKTELSRKITNNH